MDRRRTGIWLILTATLASLLVTSAQAADQPPPSARVVIAVVEDAVNVYHRDFRDESRRSHPSETISTYPRSARRLELTFGKRDLEEAIVADQEKWAGLIPGQLYFLPRTKFVGLVYLPNSLDATTTQVEATYPPPAREPLPVVDGYTYHGTGVASVAAGTQYGTCPRCDLVIVAADNPEDGLAWAAKQPWIDIVNNSWGGPLGAPTQVAASQPQRAADSGPSPASLAAAATGKVVVFASGNGLTGLGAMTRGTQHSLTWASPFAGPDWVLTVGASKARTGQPTDWHNIPVDVIAQGEERPAADNDTVDGEMTFVGTSSSAPVAAGVLGAALLRAREALGDRGVGARGGALLTTAVARAQGPLTDRRLTYVELMQAAKSVAQWKDFDPSTVASDPLQAFVTPTTDASFAYQGYGVLDRESVGPLTDVLLGRQPQPARPEMTEWDVLDRQVRTARWGTAPS